MEIQSVEGRPIKKGMSPGRRSAAGALTVLGAALGILVVGQLVQPPGIPLDHALALIRADGHVELAKPDGSAATALTGTGVPADAVALLWAPGGDFLALRTTDAVVVVDRAGVVAWRKAVTGHSASFAWSPDGSRIAILDAGGGVSSTGSARASLQVLTQSGALEWDLPLPDDFGVVTGFGNLAWSPDGGFLAFTGYTNEGLSAGLQPTRLWIGNLSSQTIVPRSEESNTFVAAPAWASDGSLYVARNAFEETGIWRIDPSTGQATLVLRRQMDSCAAGADCRFDGIDDLAPSPDGSRLAFQDATRELTVVVVGTGAITVVPGTGSLAFTVSAWASGGSSLLYLAAAPPPADPGRPRDLARFDLATGSAEAVLPDVRAFDLLTVPN